MITSVPRTSHEIASLLLIRPVANWKRGARSRACQLQHDRDLEAIRRPCCGTCGRALNTAASCVAAACEHTLRGGGARAIASRPLCRGCVIAGEWQYCRPSAYVLDSTRHIHIGWFRPGPRVAAG